MQDKSDWRLTNQEKYLKGVSLKLEKYKGYRDGWDRDHCQFCWKKFSESPGETVLYQGYATEDNYRWICIQCFEDFKDLFKWNIKE